MSEVVHYAVRDGVAVVTVDNPPVNALGPGVPEGIEAAFARGTADPNVRAIVLVGAGTTFIAGADIRYFETIPNVEASVARTREIHARLRRMEDCPKPTVAAIHGTALGGGLEFAMACHWRVAAPGAKVGQPEVSLGILPGAGGTQRLPRLCSIETAVELCTTGIYIGARRAYDEGLVDALIEGDLTMGAILFALGASTRRVRELPVKGPAGEEAFAKARAGLPKIARGARAPFANLEALEAAARLDFEHGCEEEIRLFAECVVSNESRALVKMFFAERDVAKIPGVSKQTTVSEIKRVAVVGGGTMGGGIAMAYANAGIPVLLKETAAEALERGLATIRTNYEASAAKGKLTAAEMEQRLGRITPVLTYDGFEKVDLVVEAVFEDLEIKKAVFRDLGEATRAECILASNTSTLDIDEFARASGRGGRVIGHHFFSPANVMKLLEIVRGRATDAETIATSMTLAKRLGKVGVLVGNCFAFVANRMLAYYLREAHLLLEEGATVQQIDGAMTRFGFPVGPYAMQDIAGIDVGARIRAYLRSAGKTRAEGPQSPVPDWLYERKRWGQKTGAGWYRYQAGSRTGVPDPLIEELAEEAARRRGIVRRPISDEEILNRTLTALANEGANVLEDGMALRPGDIDIIYNYGFGFPRHRGGPMLWADQTGLPRVLANVREYRDRLGAHWQPSPRLERLAAASGTFYGNPAPLGEASAR